MAERGAAILAAMLVVTIASIATSGLLTAQHLALRETAANRDAAQCRVAVRAGLAWALAVLRQDERSSRVDHLAEPWATPLPPVAVEGAELAGAIQDLQGRYNVNNLVRDGVAQPAELARYRRLLDTLGLPSMLAETLADWMDADDRPLSADSAEDAHYLSLPLPYRSPARPLDDFHELLRVKGYTAQVLAVLRPYIAVLPAPSTVNVNTAPPEVLMLVADGLSLADARLLAAERERRYFRDAADFRARLPGSAQPLPQAPVRVDSAHFLVIAEVRRGLAQARGEALVERGGAWPRILRQRID